MWMRTLYLLGLASLVWLNGASPTLAQPTSSPGAQGASSENAPRTVGAGTRSGEGGGSCAAQSKQTDIEPPTLTAIIPQTHVTLTAQERVNLYVYIPPETNQLAVLEVIELRTGEPLLEEELELSTADAIARFVLPETVQFAVHNTADQVSDNPYWWRLSIYCNPNVDQTIYVAGWINRLEVGEGETSPYFWHDELEASFAERLSNPAAWQQSLTAEALVNYADFAVETYVFESQTSSSATGGL
ncbi:MAG: DUF928 domain-containing protein [Spirulina sp. SIO3F2]|nr:DUF928 domain-containing protein [Spirulina sp. SIO3F2]